MTNPNNSHLRAQAAHESLASFMRGYGHDNTTRLRAIANRSRWGTHAGQLLDQRSYKLLEALDDSVLIEIELGTISVPAIAAAIADELDAAASTKGRARAMAKHFQIEGDTLTLRLRFTPITLIIDGLPVAMHELGASLPFARKPVDLSDFACGTPQRVFVHMHRQLTAQEFDRFAGRFMATTDWLKDTAQPVPVPGARACVMVSAPGRPILFVDTQGYSYARYVARLG